MYSYYYIYIYIYIIAIVITYSVNILFLIMSISIGTSSIASQPTSIALQPTYQSTYQPTYQSTYQPPNQNQITDMIMSNLIISKIGNVMQDDFTLSVPNIAKLLLLLSSGEIKNGINAIIVQIINYVKEIPSLIINIVLYFSKFLNRSRLSNEQIYEINQAEVQCDSQLLTITMEPNFIISFCNYVLKNKNTKFRESINNAVIKNTKENIINITIDEITIEFEDYHLKVMDKLSSSRDICTNEIVSVTCDKISASHVTSYCDLLTSEQREIVKNIYNLMDVDARANNLTLIQYVNTKIDTKLYTEDMFTEDTIVSLLLEKYPNFNRDQTFIEIMIIGCIIWTVFDSGCITHSRNQLRAYNTMLFDRNTEYKFTNHQTKLDSNINKFANHIKSYILNAPSLQGVDIHTMFKIFTIPITQKNEITKNNSTISPTLMIIPKTQNKINSQQIITNFIKTIYESYKKNTTKTKIFFVKLEDDIKTTNTPNPEYEDYENKKKLIEQTKQTDNSTNLMLFEFLAKTIPPKIITTQIINKKIECKSLNEMEKKFDTLFLREKDKMQLTNSLDMFKNKGHILRELGLQNKFNLLLYGEPGTGKSTTIQAVANYLQKDIYYIDLQKVVLNEDLHMIFEYVNKNVPNSGIIVIEDIDAGLECVHKRKDKFNEYGVNDIISNQKNKLTLEYVLNILQGTLTMDNSVFIVTTNHIDHLDPAFYRDGRFDVKIELKLCDKYQIKSIYKRMIGKELPYDVLNLIPENKFSPASIIYHVKNYIFNIDVEPMEIMEPFINK
jgi:ATP-dependent 26S proteasome regulatory subunit